MKEETTDTRRRILYMRDRIDKLTNIDFPALKTELTVHFDSKIKEDMEAQIVRLDEKFLAKAASITETKQRLTALERNTDKTTELLKKREHEYANGILCFHEIIKNFTLITLPDVVPKLTSSIFNQHERGLNDIGKLLSASEYDIWRVNQSLSRRKTVKWACSSENGTALFYDNSFEIFTHSSYLTNLHSKKYYPNSIVLDVHFGDISPNLKTLIYSKKSHKATLVIFDLCNAHPLNEIPFDSEVREITVNNNYFAVSTEKKSLLYQINGPVSKTISEIPHQNANPRLLPNDILAFRERGRLLYLYNVSTRTRMEPIDVGFKFFDIRSNSTGSTVAVHYPPDGLFKMFDAKSKQQIFEIETAGFGRLLPNPISHDTRHVAFRSLKQITVLSLDIEDDGRRTINFKSNIDCDEFAFYSSPIFRKINGVDHFQWITTLGFLHLYKLNETNKRWDRVE